MKKLIHVTLILMLVIALCSCGDQKQELSLSGVTAGGEQVDPTEDVGYDPENAEPWVEPDEEEPVQKEEFKPIYLDGPTYLQINPISISRGDRWLMENEPVFRDGGYNSVKEMLFDYGQNCDLTPYMNTKLAQFRGATFIFHQIDNVTEMQRYIHSCEYQLMCEITLGTTTASLVDSYGDFITAQEICQYKFDIGGTGKFKMSEYDPQVAYLEYNLNDINADPDVTNVGVIMYMQDTGYNTCTFYDPWTVAKAKHINKNPMLWADWFLVGQEGYSLHEAADLANDMAISMYYGECTTYPDGRNPDANDPHSGVYEKMYYNEYDPSLR